VQRQIDVLDWIESSGRSGRQDLGDHRRAWSVRYHRDAIGPGPIATELFNKANDPERIKHIVGSVPVRRIGQPQDIAYTTGFFLDARAGFINGQVLYVCGGPTVGLVPA
jgi:hypothetical protein